MNIRSLTLSIAGLSLSATLPLVAQEEGPARAVALIHVQNKSGAPLDPASLRLQVNRHDTPITSVQPVVSSAAQVAILIDDGLRGSFALQLDDVKRFIGGLPEDTRVFVGYMEQGDIRPVTEGFSGDHAAAIASIRIPFSAPGINASPYFCLSQFVKKWPAPQGGSRFVLMITNGVDPYNGSTSVLNQDSPYVQTAQEDAQRAGVAVYSIYYADAGYRGSRGSFSGQSYLAQVAEATGGESYYQGTIAPPSFAPYLKMFHDDIAQSYTVTFMTGAPRDRKYALSQIKLTSSQPGVKIRAPQNVRPAN